MRDAPQVIFDDGLGRFGPLTDLRPVFALRTGARTSRTRIEATLRTTAAALVVAPALAEVQRRRETDAVINTLPGGADHGVVFINGRWSGADEPLAQRIRALQENESLLQPGGGVLAARLERSAAESWIAQRCASLPQGVKTQTWERDVLLARPWHPLDQLEATLAFDLARTTVPEAGPLPQGVSVVGDHPVHVHPSAALLPHVVLNATAGPIVLDKNATVQPFAVIEGPAYVGPHSEIAAHTALRPHTAIAEHCKIGGEVKASIINRYSNKAHAGYLGNAIVGQWCNLGAGTTASNLKNTYGQVRMQLDAGDATQTTGRQFLGPFIGDFVRTAIGTRLPTGACIGTGCCLVTSAFAPKFAAPMTFHTDAGIEPVNLDAFWRTAEAMQHRRGWSLRDAEKQVLAGLRDAT